MRLLERSREDHAPAAPISSYGQAKIECERIVQRYINDGGDAVILRPTCVFGPGSTQWTTRLIRLLRAGRIGDLGSAGDGFCNLAFIDDVIAAILAAVDAPDISGRTFNVSSTCDLTWNEFLVTFGKALGATPVRRISSRRLRIETKLLTPVCRVLAMTSWSALSEAITPSLAALWRQDIRIDCSAARAALGLPSTTSDQGIADVVRTERVVKESAAFMSNRRTVFLACPYGQVGGGMGSIMTYLAAMRHDPSGRFDLRRLESRGGGHIALSPLFLAMAVGRILLEAARGRLAVVHLNLAERGSVYRKAVLLGATKLVGGRVLLHLHAAQIVQFQASMGGTGKALLRWMFRSADHCVVLGEVWRRWVIDTFGVRSSRIGIIYNGVPATMSKPRPSAPDGRFRLLFVGNLLERKGVKDLLHAFASHSIQSRDIILTMAGGGPVDTYRALAAELGVGDRVTFTGWVSQDDARTLMVNSDALILPAYDEGLPLVILEALASRTPVICTPVGSIPEVLEDGRTALFVSPGDEAGITNAIRKLADRPETGRELADAGAILYERMFSMEAFARSVGSLYAALTPRDRNMTPSVWPPVEEGRR